MPIVEIDSLKIKTFHCSFTIAEDATPEMTPHLIKEAAHRVVDKLLEEGMIKCQKRHMADRFGMEVVMSFKGIKPDQI